MNLLWRLLRILLCAPFRSRIAFLQASSLSFRVWPLDLDLNIHLTNSRYFSLMDLGRVDWLLRSNTWKHVRRAGLNAVLGGSLVRYRRSLTPFQRFTLTTRLLGWDERWFYFEQTMAGPGGTACLAAQRAGFTKAGRLVPPAVLLEHLAPHTPAPPLPGWVTSWSTAETAFAQDTEM